MLLQEIIRGILQGGECVCVDVGIVVVGGYSIDLVEFIYGLVVIGVFDLQWFRCNVDVCVGDVLVLGKFLGVGVYLLVLKKEVLDVEGYQQMIVLIICLNIVGVLLVVLDGVYVMIDVIGFGLFGYLLEVCCVSGVVVEVDSVQILLLLQFLDLL